MASRRRYFVYAGTFLMMALSYVDRINLSVAAKAIATTYGLSPVQMGFIFSAFLWTYLVCLVPLGIAVDRYGSRHATALCMFVWSVAGAATGASMSYAAMFASRLALGIGEAVSYPAGGRVIRLWAPRSERGLAAALLNGGSYAGLALGAPAVGWIVATFGWRASFYATGGVGVLMSILWYGLYRTPERAGWLNGAERSRILAERDEVALAVPGDTPSLGVLLRSQTMWGLALTQGCAGYTLYLFIAWLPSYLADSHHLDVVRSSAFSAVPWAAAVLLGLATATFSDRFLRRTGTAGGHRRLIVAGALLVSSALLLMPFIKNIALVLLVFSLSLTGVSTALSMLIALTSDLLVDGRLAGSATSLLIFGGNSFGIVAPIATGYIVTSPMGYSGAFVIAGVLLLVGVVTALTLTRKPIGRVDAIVVPAAILAMASRT